MDFSYVTTQDSLEGDGDLKSLIGPDRSQNKRNLPPIWSEVVIFLLIFLTNHIFLSMSQPCSVKHILRERGKKIEVIAHKKKAFVIGPRDSKK